MFVSLLHLSPSLELARLISRKARLRSLSQNWKNSFIKVCFKHWDSRNSHGGETFFLTLQETWESWHCWVSSDLVEELVGEWGHTEKSGGRVPQEGWRLSRDMLFLVDTEWAGEESHCPMRAYLYPASEIPLEGYRTLEGHFARAETLHDRLAQE